MCKQPVKKEDYIRDRVVEDVLRRLQSDEMKREGSCKMHDMKLFYFCLDCDQSLCPDCYIEDHLGHSKRRLKDVFAEKKSLIKESLEELKSHEKALT